MNHRVSQERSVDGENKLIEVRSEDGAGTAITVYSNGSRATGPVFLCTPAMGVKASYYEPVAKALHRLGAAVVTADLRGVGLSSVRASPRTDFGYREIVLYDMPAVLAAVKNEFPGRPVFLFGHSLGGQLSCLFASTAPEAVSGIVLVSSCSVYFNGWSFPVNLGILAFEQFAYLVANILGHFPGRLFHFGDREARRLVRDWSRQGLTGRYRAKGSGVDFEALLGAMELPLLTISFTDDAYGPKPAVEHLLAKMGKCVITHHHLSPDELGLERVGHFGWIQHAELIVPMIEEWLNRLNRPASRWRLP
jgi:predicted alpha/beta hydrolase